MEDRPNDPSPGSNQSEAPPPLKPSNVLDSIFQKEGPMPAAGIGLRALSFLFDFALLMAISFVIIGKFGLPANHPGAGFEFEEWSREVWTWAEAAQTQSSSERPPPPDMPNGTMEALSYCINVMFVLFWIYFGACEGFFNGSTIGKQLCCIRTVSTVTLGTQPILTGIIRGGIKTTLIFVLFPISALLTLIGLMFNKRRQMLHDLLSRTAVVDERKMKIHE